MIQSTEGGLRGRTRRRAGSPTRNRTESGTRTAEATPGAPSAAEPRPRATWVARQAHVIIPLLVLVILATPSVTFLLPAAQDYLGEIYQPMQTLKFFKTKGQEFHKYGPAGNFILAPGYAASLAYWKVTGGFDRPREDFPYGFQHPFEQIGFLILQSRALFLLIGILALGYLAHALRAATESRWAIALAMLFCVATNYAVVDQLPSPRPDSGMLAFSALALAVYVRMVFVGLTVRRGVWFSIWAALAVSSKELAGPMFVLPFLGLVAIAYRARDPVAWRTIGSSILTGVTAYALLNVVYAPATWVERMRYWLSGPGIDADIWGRGGGALDRVIGFAQCMLNNLGPGGVLMVPAALVALMLAHRGGGPPRRRVLLLLPAMSVALLGLSRIQYPADRFYTILSLALVPPVAVGIHALLERAPRPARAARAARAAMLVLAGANLWFATFAFFRPSAAFESVAERHALALNDRAATFNLLRIHPHLPGSTRLDYLGLKHDPRSIHQLIASRQNLPDWIYATQGKLAFVEHARSLPGRAAMIKDRSGMDVAAWSGLEGLGYRHERTIRPEPPRWHPFGWMPAVQRWTDMARVEVYRRESRPAGESVNVPPVAATQAPRDAM